MLNILTDVLLLTGACWLVLLPLRLARALARGRRRRHGGFSRLRASTVTKSGSARTRTRRLGRSGGTSAATRLHAAGCSSSTPRGNVMVSEVWEIPRMLRDRSRLTGRGWSTPMIAAPGTSGAPPDTAVSDDLTRRRQRREQLDRLRRDLHRPNGVA